MKLRILFSLRTESWKTRDWRGATQWSTCKMIAPAVPQSLGGVSYSCCWWTYWAGPLCKESFWVCRLLTLPLSACLLVYLYLTSCKFAHLWFIAVTFMWWLVLRRHIQMIALHTWDSFSLPSSPTHPPNPLTITAKSNQSLPSWFVMLSSVLSKNVCVCVCVCVCVREAHLRGKWNDKW